jgi:hypothetical protein
LPQSSLSPSLFTDYSDSRFEILLESESGFLNFEFVSWRQSIFHESVTITIDESRGELVWRLFSFRELIRLFPLYFAAAATRRATQHHFNAKTSTIVVVKNTNPPCLP